MNEIWNRKIISSGVIEKKNVQLGKMTDKLCVLAPTWETVLSINETVQKIFSSVCQGHWTRASLKRIQQEPPLSGMMNSIQHETIQVLGLRQTEHSSWSWEEQLSKGFYTNAKVQHRCFKKLHWNGCETPAHPSAMFLSILDSYTKLWA